MSGDTVVVGANGENIGTTGVNSIPDESATQSGASYIFTGLGPAEIVVEAPTGTGVVSGAGAPSFPQTAPGQTSDLSLTIRNAGGADLTGILPTLSGTDASQFQIFTAPASFLLGGETTTFTVRFALNTPGIKTATLSIASNDLDANSFTIALTGTGNTPPAFAGYGISAAWQAAARVSLVKLLAKASDADGDVLSVTAAGPVSAQGGTVVLESGSILYTPPNGFPGSDSFTVTITDVRGGSVVGTVTVTVGPSPTDGGLGSNPPRLTMLPRGHVGISFHGIPGRQYQIQRSTDLSHWTTIHTAADNGAVTFTDEAPPSPNGFYRLRQP